MPTGELQGLVREDEVQRHGDGMLEPLVESSAAKVLEVAWKAVGEMDSEGLERILTRGAMALSVSTVIDDVIVPLLSGIGTAWKAGRIGPAHEHLATVVVRRFLEWVLGTVEVGATAPVLVTGTPAGGGSVVAGGRGCPLKKE